MKPKDILDAYHTLWKIEESLLGNKILKVMHIQSSKNITPVEEFKI